LHGGSLMTQYSLWRRTAAVCGLSIAVAFVSERKAFAADYIIAGEAPCQTIIIFKDMIQTKNGVDQPQVEYLILKKPADVINGKQVYYDSLSFLFQCKNKTFTFWEESAVDHGRILLRNGFSTQQARAQPTTPTGPLAVAVERVCNSAWTHTDGDDFAMLDKTIAAMKPAR
jgi:hypothetical protein